MLQLNVTIYIIQFPSMRILLYINKSFYLSILLEAREYSKFVKYIRLNTYSKTYHFSPSPCSRGTTRRIKRKPRASLEIINWNGIARCLLSLLSRAKDKTGIHSYFFFFNSLQTIREAVLQALQM